MKPVGGSVKTGGWQKRIRLEINQNKTKYMRVSRKNTSSSIRNKRHECTHLRKERGLNIWQPQSPMEFKDMWGNAKDTSKT